MGDIGASRDKGQGVAGASSGSYSRALLAIILGALMGIGAYAGWRCLTTSGMEFATLDPEEMARLVRSWGPWGAFGSMLLMILHSFLPLPSEVIAFANGMIFGPWLGVAVTWSGAMLGAILSYALARWLGRPFVRWALPERHWQRIDAIPTRAGVLLIVRLMPVISFNLVNYAAGLLGVRWWPFLWTTGLGILPLTIAMVLLGHEMLGAPWLSLTVLAAIVFASWLTWHLLRARDRS